MYKYKVNRTIQLGPLVCIIDIDGNRDGVMCLSTSSSVELWYKNIQCQSPSGGYVAFQGEMSGQLQFIYGNKNSVLKQCVKSQLCIEPVVLWGKNTNICTDVQPGCSPIFGYSPQGLAVGKSGHIWVCLWNSKVGTESLGTVISLTKKNRNFHR